MVSASFLARPRSSRRWERAPFGTPADRHDYGEGAGVARRAGATLGHLGLADEGAIRPRGTRRTRGSSPAEATTWSTPVKRDTSPRAARLVAAWMGPMPGTRRRR